jgi:predicted nucleic acid-binding protein
MKALLDASALLLLVKHADATRLADAAKDLATLDLAAYEVGNAIWKQVHLQKLVTQEEARATHEALMELLSHVSLVRGEELNQTEAMNLAIRKGIAYYDACYLIASESLKLPLATEDRKLAAAKARREVIGWEQVLGDGRPEGGRK